jgi:hypothetical protein
MSESYRIAARPVGEPLAAGRVGVCVRVPLSGCPSKRWSHALSAELVNELAGRPAVGHLRISNVVQGDQIVLEGVEEPEASHLGDTLRRAIDVTNERVARAEAREGGRANATRADASAIARQVDSDPAR